MNKREYKAQVADILTPEINPAAPTRAERDYMKQVAAIAKRRIRGLGLKGKAAQRDTEAVLQGAITVAVATGVMTTERAGIIGFFVSVGRIDMILNDGEPAEN